MARGGDQVVRRLSSQEQQVLVVEPVTTVGPGQDDPVGGAGARRGAVRDVDAGPLARSTRAPATPSMPGVRAPGRARPGTRPARPAAGDRSGPRHRSTGTSTRTRAAGARDTEHVHVALAVRADVQPSGWALTPLSVAGPTWLVVQVAPPSLERETMSGVGERPAVGVARNEAQQT